jgi:hypothetical protein
VNSSLPDFSSAPIYFLGRIYRAGNDSKTPSPNPEPNDENGTTQEKQQQQENGNKRKHKEAGGWLSLKSDNFFLQSLQRSWGNFSGPEGNEHKGKEREKEGQLKETKHIREFLRDFASRIWLTYRYVERREKITNPIHQHLV